MTTPTASTSAHDAGWVDELATYVGPGCFPATHDDLAATLIRRHAPSHLLWHLSVLSRTREFRSLDELVEVLAAHGTTGRPGDRRGPLPPDDAV